MAGRKYSASYTYRYGFNGKENDNEVKGEANQLNFGSRIYDSRLGRFLSIDPLTIKYPSLSPYLYALNNPIVMIDRDGEDAIVSITRNKDGGGLIKIQTVIHITGSTEDRHRQYTDAAKKTYANQSVNIEGKVWNIQYDIKYEYNATFDASKMQAGHNTLKIDPNTPPSGPNRTHVNPGNNTQGFIAVDHRANTDIIGHETGHQIGFVDQYTEISAEYSGFREYLKAKYNTKEDTKPGGKNWDRLEIARKNGFSITLSNEGYENNEMQNNKGGFTDEQNKALVNKVLSVSNGKDGSFIIQGYFDKRGTPSQANLQKAYENLDNQIQQATIKNDETPKK